MRYSKDRIRKKYSGLFNYSKDLIFIHDLQGNLLDANERAVKAFGYNRDEISSITLPDLFIQESMAKIKKQIKKISKGNKPTRDNIFKMKTKQGEIISINSYGIPLCKNDNVHAILNIARKVNSKNLTKKKSESEITLESEKKYGFLSDQANDMVMVINDNFEYEYINEDAFYRLMGYKKEDILGVQAIKLVHPDDKEKILKLAKKGFKNGEASAEFRFRDKDGHWVWLESRGKTFTDNKGNLKGIIISRDITERKKTKKKLRERIKELGCLYKIYELIQKANSELEEIFQKIVKLIPKAWQFPKITCAKISYEGQEFKTTNYNKTKWKLSTKITINGQPKGAIKVYYLEQTPEFDEGKFLKEERDLIENIATILETYIREKMAEKALKQSEQKYRSLFNNMSAGFAYHRALYDQKGKPIDYIFLEVNSHFEKLSGLKKENIIGKKVTHVLPGIENDPANWIGRYGKVALTGNQIEFENFSEPLQRWYYVTAYSPKKEYFACIFMDITEQKRVEKKLKESEKRYYDLIEHAPYPILLLDFESKIIDCNKELENLLKMDKGKIIGKKFYNLDIFIEEKKLNKLKRNLNDLFSGNEPELIEFRIKNRENQIRWIKTNSRHFRYEDGQYVQMILADITSIKETQKLKDQLNRELEKKVQERTKELEKVNKLIRRKLNFEKVISKISSRFVGTINLDKAITATLEDLGESSAADRVYIFLFNDDGTMSNEYEWCAEGVSAEKDNLQNLPKSMFPWWIETLKKRNFIHIENVSNMPPEASTEEEMLEEQGVKSILVYPIYVEDKLYGFIGYDNLEETRKWERSMLTSLKIVSEIISNKFEHQLALRKQKLYLEQVTKASQFKSQFMASMSHELRTPLNSIIGFTDLLLEEAYGKVEESQFEFLENISSSSQHLLNLIDEIMDISKIESGAMELQIEEISIKPFLDNVISEFKPILKEKGLEVKINGTENPRKIQADPIKLRSIFYNLLSNAVKFTVNGTISIDFSETEKFWEFQVRDTGIGIKKEDYDKVFKEFKRIESPYISNSEGTGLGLPLARRVVNLHGGRIWFDSELGVGTTFFFTLPKMKKAQKRGKIQKFFDKL
ncbi:MAG: PAS domain S-box protein [Promethearchaeia archaeon]